MLNVENENLKKSFKTKLVQSWYLWLFLSWFSEWRDKFDDDDFYNF